jgi:hypothetical protein
LRSQWCEEFVDYAWPHPSHNFATILQVLLAVSLGGAFSEDWM